MKPLVRTGKTVLLVALVVLSIVLSYFLWSGNLKEGSEIGIVQDSPMPTETTPDVAHAVRPYRIVVQAAGGTTIANPDSSAYTNWLSALATAHALDRTTIHQLPQNVDFQVTLQFGTEVNHTLAGKWLNPFSSTIGKWSGRSIILYKPKDDTNCRVAFPVDNGMMTVKTDLPATTLWKQADKQVSAAPYDVLDGTSGPSYIPRALSMSEFIYSVRQPDTLPLVHTFFVNPQAITRIQQDQNTSLWTDGSRAVLWDKQTMDLQYEDPNGTQVPLHDDALLSGIDFIHSHGGGPQSVIAFDQLGSLTVNPNAPSYVLTQYVDGFPILSNTANYNINMENGRVLEYDRPMWVLEQPVAQSAVHVLDRGQLLNKLKSLDPADTPTNLRITLGYALVTNQSLSAQNEVQLQPVYYVTSGSGAGWMVDAQSGSLVLGSDPS
ncbi:hypothetical protein AAC03nite_30670 [Alicyclobacillus acidoterrestris]|uniref:two-component system activity regulator YycH n=1 Tax=Alicyclobacillus suci TaxID=2816080 RepID=UPI0011928E48|nr:two-component system activity regulator YycH [Alicyclobacillus suci]GEO27282.1 hypothetical protein AAC03nite_30670 [Alicyclobacillus acidoterrestris]